MESKEIREILENVMYWDVCPSDYKKTIKEYLEQLQPKEESLERAKKTEKSIHENETCKESLDVEGLKEKIVDLIDNTLNIDTVYNIAGEYLLADKIIKLFKQYATQQSKQVSDEEIKCKAENMIKLMIYEMPFILSENHKPYIIEYGQIMAKWMRKQLTKKD